MESASGEQQPAAVRSSAKQVGEAQDNRWDWVERTVWTDRMLAALETGVKGGMWFSLIDKVWRKEALRSGFARVKANKGGSGVDNQSIEAFEEKLNQHLERLQREVRDGSYRPRPIKRVWIDKPGSTEKRPLGIPTVRDRVVQTTLRNALEPIFEREFCAHSYGFRPHVGCKDALRRVEDLLNAGYHWVVDADLKGSFDSIPQDRLMAEVARRIADSRILGVVKRFLAQEILEGLEHWTPERGTPQGAVISPLLANIYLHPVDQAMAEAGYEMVRYADDFVILCRSREEAERALAHVRALCQERELTLHPDKTRSVDAPVAGKGFDFLGYHFERGTRWPRRKSEQKLKDALRRKTRRTNGQSMEYIIADVNRTLRGWFAYFKHSHYTTFRPLDRWLRRRLRSILRKRTKRRGISRGLDHHRWPNQYFRARGLIFLAEAHHACCPSARG